MHVNILRFLFMRCGQLLYIGSEESNATVVMIRRIGREHHKLLPCSPAESRLFAQFALCGLKRRLARVNNAGYYLVARLTYSMTVLVYHNHTTVFGHGYHIHPIGKLQYMPGRDAMPVGQLYLFLPDGQPRPNSQDILTLQYFPLPVLQRLYHTFFSILLINIPPSPQGVQNRLRTRPVRPIGFRWPYRR